MTSNILMCLLMLMCCYILFSMTIDDEDELLYGESSLPFTSVEDTHEKQEMNV